jgi:hypothetical protein
MGTALRHSIIHSYLALRFIAQRIVARSSQGFAEDSATSTLQ